MEPDFSGWAVKNGLKCTDGRTIMEGAFAHQDGMKVPVVYQHNHKDINQVLGSAILTAKPEGTWADVYLNKEVPSAINAKALVKNGDIDKFSVWAKELEERGFMVHDGVIQEVSLVLQGANSGATIQNVLMHSSLDQDDLMIVGNEIYTSSFNHDDVEPEEKETEENPEEEPGDDETVGDVLETLTPVQRTAVNQVIDDVATEAVTKALAEQTEITHDDMDTKKGTPMSRNPFQNNAKGRGAALGVASTPDIKHEDMVSVLSTAKGTPGNLKAFDEGNSVGSLREFMRGTRAKELMHAEDYGVDNMDILFPDAQALMSRPVFVDRRQEWVKTFLGGTSHSPFSRVKTYYADITADEARAKGYIKAHEKTDEVFPVFKRETGPAWVIKKQKLDRQDIIDITSFDVVAWMKVEMRGKLDEEIARAAMFGDGRPTMVGGDINPDKIPDPGAGNNSGNGIRAIINDHSLYTKSYNVPMPADSRGEAWNALLDASIEADEDYKGSGNKIAFVSFRTASRLLTIRDAFGKRIYRNLSEVAGDMGVSKIEKVPTELFPTDVLAIVLDLSDYNFGTDRGGELTFFDDFDIKFNQYHYLYETYLSGALIMPYSAQVFRRVDPEATELTPAVPAFLGNVVTIPTMAGVQYRRGDTNAIVAGGTTITLDDAVLPIIEITAEPTGPSYVFDEDAVTEWEFEHQA